MNAIIRFITPADRVGGAVSRKNVIDAVLVDMSKILQEFAFLWCAYT